MKKILFSLVLMISSLYSVNISSCVGCHGVSFEKKALGSSLVVHDMGKKEIIKALKGYKNNTYGHEMKEAMKGFAKMLSNKEIVEIAELISSGSLDKLSLNDAKKYIDLNKNSSTKKRIKKESLGNKKIVSEKSLGLRKTNLYKESKKTKGSKTDYKRNIAGTSQRFERAYENAPPMIPHSLDGLLPITINNNQCIGCHMPDIAGAVGATPLPETHFTDYRPKLSYKNGVLRKDGKKYKNTTDIKLAKATSSKTLESARFSCMLCHAPQSKTNTVVGNTFKPDFLSKRLKIHSNLVDTMNEGVK